jgi:hypothetical protein
MAWLVSRDVVAISEQSDSTHYGGGTTGGAKNHININSYRARPRAGKLVAHVPGSFPDPSWRRAPRNGWLSTRLLFPCCVLLLQQALATDE